MKKRFLLPLCLCLVSCGGPKASDGYNNFLEASTIDIETYQQKDCSYVRIDEKRKKMYYYDLTYIENGEEYEVFFQYEALGRGLLESTAFSYKDAYRKVSRNTFLGGIGKQ